MSVRDVIQAAAGASGSVEKTFVEDVFSCALYTGNGSTQTINNGIDLAGKGGVVFARRRPTNSDLSVYDTARGAYKQLATNTQSSEANTTPYGLTSFNSNGFSLGANWAGENESGQPTVSWTFRKAPKFFDVVTYTGNGVAGRTVAHSLGSVPGMIIVKKTSGAGDWYVYHRSTGATKTLCLNQTIAAFVDGGFSWYNTEPTSSVFSLGTDTYCNASGQTYVAYLFAHDTSTDGLIQCGSFSGTGDVNLGWEPQYILIKPYSQVYNWIVIDNMRGFTAGPTYSIGLNPNTTSAESGGWGINITPTGFTNTTFGGAYPCIYMAIRRGPMRTPTDGTKVFDVKVANSVAANTAVSTTNLADAVLYLARTSNPLSRGIFFDRLRGLTSTNSRWLGTAISNEEFAQNANCLSAQQNTGIIDNFTNYNLGAINTQYSILSRAPGFFDVVCYTGTGVARTVNHNLGVAPELYIIKCRSTSATDWMVFGSVLGNPTSSFTYLNATFGTQSYANVAQTPTATTFGIGAATGWANGAQVNASGSTYVAYLFASCPGVSKVFSFTGNGSSQTINCGFTNGARLVLIKRTDSTGDWYIWDTARGIVAGNDPHLSLNSTAAEVTANDTIDPDSTGFIVNQVSATNVNVNGASYIGLAIA